MNSDYFNEARTIPVPAPKIALVPLHDRVIVRKVEAEERTAGGIIIPDNAKEKPQQGEVLACGPGKFDERGGRCQMTVKPGDQVLFTKYSGSEIKYKGEMVLIIAERDVLAIVPAEVETTENESGEG